MPGQFGENYVQVSPDSTGKQIRNFSLQIQEDNGSFSTVYCQAIRIVDEFGNQVYVQEDTDWKMQMLDELRAIRMCLQAQFSMGNAIDDEDDFLEKAQAFRDPLES